ncbi:MAG: OmpA family protein [Woeseia sp.]|nr:OmpA family protein [Woeseia sp.]
MTEFKKTTRRYWRRTTTTKPWWPWGLAPLAALGMLFLVGALFMAPRIEADVREQVAERISSVDLPVAEVRADGQGVMITAATQADETRYVEAFAASTKCETWAGQLNCPTTIDIQTVAPAAAPAAASVRPHAFTVEKTGASVLLKGEVPDLAEHDRLLDRANKNFAAVTNQLRISNEAAGEQFGIAADRALTVASGLTSGRASWSGSAFSVNGTADSGEITRLRNEFGAFPNESSRGIFNVRALTGAEQCGQEFDEALSNASVKFRVGSAEIDTGNDVLLNRLTELANSCPGTLTVQGHTDSQGDAAMNEALSLARASAVREALITRGIDAERLRAVGFGESRPIADNDTAAGRATNRRIAISIEE